MNILFDKPSNTCIGFGTIAKSQKILEKLSEIWHCIGKLRSCMTHFGAPTNTSSGIILEHQSLIYNLILKHTSTSCTILEQWNFGAPNQQYQE